MRVQLTRKLAAALNGVDLSGASIGDLLEVSARDGRMLISEGWAVEAALKMAGEMRSTAADKPRQRKERRKKPRARTAD